LAEDNNYDNRSSGQNNSPQKRSINVTQPKSPQAQMSNIDASRISDYTLREQQSLEKLKKKIGAVERKESKASKIKSIVAIMLVVILIIIIVAFLLLLNQKGKEPEKYF
jgi:preprotein translocase subunit SecF